MERRDHGFTLVELMVVVLIIGIVAAIALPLFAANRHRSEQRTCLANQRVLASAIQAYAANTGAPLRVDQRYTGSSWNIYWLYTSDLEPARGTSWSAQGFIPNYLRSAPRCPTAARMNWGYYILAQPTAGNSPVTVWADNATTGWCGPAGGGQYYSSDVQHYGIDPAAHSANLDNR